MKHLPRFIVLTLFLAGTIGLSYLSVQNEQIASEIEGLELELGRLSITDENQVYFAEVKSPEVPPEVAPHVERVWQFRYFLPAGYDYMELSGSGRVTKEGIYLDGGYGSSSGMARKEPEHQLMTISIQKLDDQVTTFYSLGGSSGTTSWHTSPTVDVNKLVIQQLVKSQLGPRSFDKESILPLLKVYNPESADEKEVDGRKITTYEGFLFVVCPKSREAQLDQLRRGITPSDFEPSWLAVEADDE